MAQQPKRTTTRKRRATKAAPRSGQRTNGREPARRKGDRLRVRDVMTPYPTCCAPDDSVLRAVRVMKSEDVGAVPVVEHDRRLVGIVTDRDLALEIVAAGRDPERTIVETVMTHNPVVCNAGDDVEAVLGAMGEHRVRRVPVVDDKGRIVGIVAQADVAMRIGEAIETAEVVEEISEPND